MAFFSFFSSFAALLASLFLAASFRRFLASRCRFRLSLLDPSTGLPSATRARARRWRRFSFLPPSSVFFGVSATAEGGASSSDSSLSDSSSPSCSSSESDSGSGAGAGGAALAGDLGVLDVGALEGLGALEAAREVWMSSTISLGSVLGRLPAAMRASQRLIARLWA